MIDIHKSVIESKKHKTLTVMFGEEDAGIIFEIKPRRQRKLCNQYQNISARASRVGQEDIDMRICPDWHGLAIELADDAIDWVGIPGDFDKAILKEWLENNGKYAESLGQGFKNALDTYDEANTVKQEEERKNS